MHAEKGGDAGPDRDAEKGVADTDGAVRKASLINTQ
jgi:hypothetical protein